ncbi:hypothetical protein NLX83_40015 [Allokutzneria sp. A3M-2-11 16]|uniref:hypothetical protein n=1 Tax=Allokutzneria sp. A3M-2-11 16 TaxID=2962043 RepID=UPI0020B8713B|nr:hypothetical protein [Allokutzneria sp. A3M-2-11 16]MCP3805470.1 hypothetical protein [Allokutzneria sp. A3M-2-11 16]
MAMTWQRPGPYQPPWTGPPPQRVSPGVLAGVSAWRLLIVVFALYGFSDATGWTKNWAGLSQQASLATGIIYTFLLLYPLFTGGRRHEPESPWLRGATTVLLLLVMGTFFGVMGGDFDEQPFEHVWTPLVVLIDWIFVGRNQARTKWWYPLTWIAFPLAYLVYFLSAEVYRKLYKFLNPTKSGFAGTIIGFLLAVIAVGFLLYGLAKLREMFAGRSLATQPQGPSPISAPFPAQGPGFGPQPGPGQAGYGPQPGYGPPPTGPQPAYGPPLSGPQPAYGPPLSGPQPGYGPPPTGPQAVPGPPPGQGPPPGYGPPPGPPRQ